MEWNCCKHCGGYEDCVCKDFSAEAAARIKQHERTIGELMDALNQEQDMRKRDVAEAEARRASAMQALARTEAHGIEDNKARARAEARYKKLKRRYAEVLAVFLYPSRFYPEEIRALKKKLKRKLK